MRRGRGVENVRYQVAYVRYQIAYVRLRIRNKRESRKKNNSHPSVSANSIRIAKRVGMVDSNAGESSKKIAETLY